MESTLFEIAVKGCIYALDFTMDYGAAGRPAFQKRGLGTTQDNGEFRPDSLQVANQPVDIHAVPDIDGKKECVCLTAGDSQQDIIIGIIDGELADIRPAVQMGFQFITHVKQGQAGVGETTVEGNELIVQLIISL